MENKKSEFLLALVVIAFVAVTLLLIKDFNTKRAKDLKEYAATLNSVVHDKDRIIANLTQQLQAKEKENDDLKNTLGDTRNSLDALSKRLAQPTTPVAVPVAVPVEPAVKK